MADRFYLTTPLYYVNAPAHIGHSYTNIAADTIARYMRIRLGQDNVWLLTGTDEHGQKIEKASYAQGLMPQAFADKAAFKFKELWGKLEISYNDFIRTTQDRHISLVERALEILYEKKEIFQDKYEGLYCTPCESFWLESQAPQKSCPDCQRPLERISEVNYFLNLEKHRAWLISYINDNPDFIRPLCRRNEVLKFLEMNSLSPLCISRPKERLSWGIKLPFSQGHVAYVWFDALLNYISAVGEFDDNGAYCSKWWPADLHLIGKDILRQHAVYWPIMLNALGIALPKCIFAHGWWMVGETKMSKSRGNVISPLEVIERFGIDAYRYFLLRDVPFGQDGNFSEEAVIKRYNSDLANDLGNLVYRSLTMVEKYFSSVLPKAGLPIDPQARLIIEKMSSLDGLLESSLCAAGDFNLSACLEKVWAVINMANKYIEETKPWNLAKENRQEELKSFICLLVEVIRKVKSAIHPFMPSLAAAIDGQFSPTEAKKGSPLFPRIE